jgi:hypothetical protein
VPSPLAFADGDQGAVAKGTNGLEDARGPGGVERRAPEESRDGPGAAPSVEVRVDEVETIRVFEGRHGGEHRERPLSPVEWPFQAASRITGMVSLPAVESPDANRRT